MKPELRFMLFVIIGATLWGVIGLFTRPLYGLGLSPFQITFARCLFTLITITVIILTIDRKLLIINIKDVWMFIGTGLISIVFFNVMYFTSQQMVSLSTASVLLYTAPCFVMILSIILFKEKLTRNKLLALATAFIGCLFTTGLGFGDMNIGFLYGILAGFGYALYSIFGKYALRKYGLLTILFYTFLVSTICLIPFANVPCVISSFGDTNVLLLALGLGLLSTVLPYYFYTIGLKGMDAGKASIIAFVEPMVATVVSIIIGDEFGWMNVLGIALILGSIILLNIGTEESAQDVSS